VPPAGFEPATKSSEASQLASLKPSTSTFATTAWHIWPLDPRRLPGFHRRETGLLAAAVLRSDTPDQRRAGEATPPYDHTRPSTRTGKGADVIILGVILLVLGLILNIQILYILGAILAIAGVVLLVLGRSGRALGGRRHWF